MGVSKFNPASQRGVDSTPTAGSTNLIESGAVAEALGTLSDAVAIVIDGNQSALGAAVGQYVIVRNSTITDAVDGLYTAAQAIPANTAIDATYLTAVSGGGLNDVITKNVHVIRHVIEPSGSVVLRRKGAPSYSNFLMTTTRCGANSGASAMSIWWGYISSGAVRDLHSLSAGGTTTQITVTPGSAQFTLTNSLNNASVAVTVFVLDGFLDTQHSLDVLEFA